MKKLLLILLVFPGFVLSDVSLLRSQGSKAQTFAGEIMDSQCAAMGSHEAMMKMEGTKNAKECTLACVKQGGKFVLYDAGSKTTYQLDNQEKSREFAGQKVKVSGTLDEKSKTIHVQNIQTSS
jgi:hypothetical protein